MAGNDRRDVFLNQIQNVLDYCFRLGNTDVGAIDTTTRDSILQRLHSLRRDIRRASPLIISAEDSDQLEAVVESIESEYVNLVIFDGSEGTGNNVNAFHPERVAAAKGAPVIQITFEQLSFLQKHGFTAGKMAEVLQTSQSTICRRLRSFGMHLRFGKYDDISDNALDEKMKEIIGTNRQIGPNSILPRLKQLGIIVQRERVRLSCQRVDPLGCTSRSLGRRNIQRRTYKVAGPNSLWHIDGNHKLVRWGFYIHGGIDGYSRLVTFLGASDNNTASTVLKLFERGINLYSVPSRIRVDHGVENVDICRFMGEYRGENRGSAMQGKSCHNQRIERLWVDVWESVVNEYHDLFTYMEDKNVLDLAKREHVNILHFVFLPRLNASLELFRFQYNNHGLSTEHHRSPIEIFISGTLQQFNADDATIQELVSSEERIPVGIDMETSDDNQDEESEQYIETIRAQVNPMELPTDVPFGATLFSRALSNMPQDTN